MGLRFVTSEEVTPYLAVTDLAHELLALHRFANGNSLVEEGWKFKISNTKQVLGRCDFATKTIEFSQYYLNAPQHEILDTLLHEIAHALVGPRHGHNYVFYAMCRQVGAKPERCAPPEVKSSAQYNFVIKCEVCNKKWYRYRLRQSAFTWNHCGETVKVYKVKKGN